MRKIITCIALLWAQIAVAETINVADHGIVPGEDASYKLNKLIESIKDSENVTLSFPKGQYEFFPESAVTMWRAVTNHDNSLKHIAFPLHGYKNLTIDGGGSTFMFHGRISPFSVDGSQNITLKNFSIDWHRSFHDELKVVESDAKQSYIIVEADPKKYPHFVKGGKLYSQKYNWYDKMDSNIIFDPKTRAPIYNTGDYSIAFATHKASEAGKNRFKIQAKFRKTPPPVGSVLISYGSHPTSRLSPAIHLSSAKDIKIEKVTIYDAGGMGVIAERVENIHLDGVKITSTEDRLVATRADATHFLGCAGTIKVENCLFEHMLDDAINVHGAYIKVEKYLGNREFLCEISHFQQTGLIFATPGDTVALMSRTTILPFHESTVVDTRIINENRVVVTVAYLPEDLPDGRLSIENLTWNPDLIFTKNTIRENRARGMLITTKGKVLIEDNYISPQMHGILIEGDNNKWYESGAVENVIIRKNEFVNPGYEGIDRYPLYAAPLLTKEQHLGEGRYHRGIKFIDNTIKSFNGHLVHATSVDGLEISGNTIKFSTDYPKLEKYPSIDLDYSDNVTIKNNKAVGFDRQLGIEQADDTENVTIESNKGFKLLPKTPAVSVVAE